MATKAEREKAFIKQRAAELRAQGKPVDRAKLAERFDTLAAETKEGRQTITGVVHTRGIRVDASRGGCRTNQPRGS
jgi:predicted transcriptional regulator